MALHDLSLLHTEDHYRLRAIVHLRRRLQINGSRPQEGGSDQWRPLFNYTYYAVVDVSPRTLLRQFRNLAILHTLRHLLQKVFGARLGARLQLAEYRLRCWQSYYLPGHSHQLKTIISKLRG